MNDIAKESVSYYCAIIRLGQGQQQQRIKKENVLLLNMKRIDALFFFAAILFYFSITIPSAPTSIAAYIFMFPFWCN